MAFWENFLPGASNAAGLGYLFNQMNNNQQDQQKMFNDLLAGIPGRTQFQPWGVKSNLGTAKYADGQFNLGLTGEALDRYNQMQRLSGQMMQRASQDPTQARNEYYDMMRAAQSPEEQRQKQMMDARLQAQGRSGIKSNAYGGTPEQLAYYKAQEEAKNTAMLSADQMAQQGLLNQFQMGSGMFRDSYLPQEMLLRQAQLGLNNAQLQQQGQLAGADMFNQATIGRTTMDQNYDNMRGNMLMQFMTSMTQPGGPLAQAGQGIDNMDWGWLKDLFGFGD